LSPEIIHFSIVDATVPFEVPFVLPTEGLGIVETLEEHFEIMNLEVDIPEDYVGPWPAYPFSPSDHIQTMHYCFEMLPSLSPSLHVLPNEEWPLGISLHK
jgi:hypothetical protein